MQTEYLQGLPSLNSTNMDDLRERLDIIDERIQSFRDENDNISEDMDSLINIKKNFDKSDEQLQNEALDSIQSIYDRVDDMNIPEPLRFEILDIQSFFEYSGIVHSAEVSYMNDVANRIIDWRYSIERDDTTWANRVDGIADDIRYLANKHDARNNTSSEELESVTQIDETLSNLGNQYRKNRKAINDLEKEFQKTQDTIDSKFNF